MQKAAVRACRNAIEFNSLPAIRKLVCSRCMRLHDLCSNQLWTVSRGCMHLGACCAFCCNTVLVTLQVPNGYDGLKLCVKIGVPEPVINIQQRLLRASPRTAVLHVSAGAVCVPLPPSATANGPARQPQGTHSNSARLLCCTGQRERAAGEGGVPVRQRACGGGGGRAARQQRHSHCRAGCVAATGRQDTRLLQLAWMRCRLVTDAHVPAHVARPESGHREVRANSLVAHACCPAAVQETATTTGTSRSRP
jgi:hypothetical protein